MCVETCTLLLARGIPLYLFSLGEGKEIRGGRHSNGDLALKKGSEQWLGLLLLSVNAVRVSSSKSRIGPATPLAINMLRSEETKF